MTITCVKGDLIKAFKSGEVSIIAHQCNCFNTLGKGKARGLACTIGKEFPEASYADRDTVAGDKRKLGTFAKAKTKHGYIYNLYGQYNYGNSAKSGIVYTDLEALCTAMTFMKYDIIDMQLQNETVGFPLIGCGLAGAKWEEVEQLIESIFSGFDVKVYTYD